MTLRIAILGAVELHMNGSVVGVPAGKQRALLTMLAVRAPHPVSAESAAEALWPRAAPPEAMRSLQVTVSRLRRSLADAGVLLETVASSYRLAIEADAIDARRFETLINAARAARVEGDAAAARRLLDDALGLWRGPALADVQFESFAQAEIARLEELRVAALEERIDVRLSQGEHALVVAELEQLSAEHPSRERLVGLLMLALYRCGRQTEALEVYTRGRLRLDEELGLEPLAELQRLQEAILRHDPSLAAVGFGDRDPTGRAPEGVVTMLFTDIEGSTRLARAAGSAWSRVLAEHHALVLDAVEGAGGYVDATEGDAFFATFVDPGAAVEAASAAQRALRCHEWPEPVGELRVRMGIHAGLISRAATGYSGLEVHLAARVMAAGHGGQILVSAAARALLGARSGLVDLGEHRLKDFPAPERLWLLVHDDRGPGDFPPLRTEPVAELDSVAPSLPAQLRPRPAMPLVGRAADLDRLAALPDRARTDGRQLALVGGEPGSGKTRLARELAEHVTANGMHVLYGACDPAVRTPYQPFVEALEPALATLRADEPEQSAARYPASLNRLLPGLRAGAGDPAEAIADAQAKDPDAERLELHAALAALLARLARHSPAVLVLDDVQWADASSLSLLRHLARTLGATPMVVLALFREGDGLLPEALASTLGELHRLEGVVRVRLQGLAVADVQELVDRSGDSVRGAGLAEQLVGLTDGNAFLVGEVWRHMVDQEAAASPADMMIPESVREVMAHRVAGLTPGLSGLLQLIAVSPRGIALPILRAAADIDDEALMAALEEGVNAALLDEIRDASIVYRVRHELLRRTVYERLSSFRAAALHLRVGEALEALPGGRHDRIVNELAFHFRMAAPIAGDDRAMAYTLDAASQAESSFAFAEAAARFEDALALGSFSLPGEAEVRCRQGLAWHLAGRASEALESFAAAAAAARGYGDAALQARAAIGFETACWRPGINDPRAVALLQEAARGIPAEPGAQRVRVLAHLSRALAYRGDHAAAGECWSQAVTMARVVGDPGALMVALSHAAWTRGSRALDEILADLTEAGELARMLPHDPVADVASGMRIGLLIEAFAIDEARADIAAHRELSEHAGQHFLSVIVEQHDALLALCDGRLDAAEAAAKRADEVARQIDGGPSAAYGIQMFSIRREQGRLAEIAPVVRLIASGEMDAGGAVWRPALAVLLAEIGDVEAARRELHALVNAGLGAIPRGGLGVGGLAYAADACALIEDAALAAPIYEEVLILEGQNTMVGSAVACYGAADRMLGALATVMERWDDAERHLENALGLNQRLGSPTWIAHTQYERARLALRRVPAPSPQTAREPAFEALEAARRIGLRALLERIERLIAAA